MLKIPKLLVPIGLFISYLAVAIFIRSKFSDTTSFLNAIQGAYANIGYLLIFFGAVLESMFLVGLFVPGSVVLLMGAALSRLGIVEYPYVFILGTSGLILGYTINYFLGKYGWYNILSFFGLSKGIEIGKTKLRKHGARTILWGYFIPGSASLLSTACGVLNMNFNKFLILSILAQSFWSLFWGTIAYFFGIQIVEFIIKYFIFVLIGMGIVWGIKKFVKR
jgi:undecaprenyl-diphosphatase